MFGSLPEASVEETDLSTEEWAAMMAMMSPSQKATYNEKRVKQPPIPLNKSDILTTLQKATIQRLEGFGWELMFIRRSNPRDIITVMHLPFSNETALIEKDGSVNRAHNIIVRPN